MNNYIQSIVERKTAEMQSQFSVLCGYILCVFEVFTIFDCFLLQQEMTMSLRASVRAFICTFLSWPRMLKATHGG